MKQSDKKDTLSLRNLHTALPDASKAGKETSLDIFMGLKNDVWGEEVEYTPPIMRGEPKCILLLYEKKEQRGALDTCDTEEFLERLFDSTKLNDIWVIDVLLDSRTEIGQNIKSPQKNQTSGKWVRRLVSSKD